MRPAPLGAFGIANQQCVVYWCVQVDPDNLDSLRDKREKGNYQKATEEYPQFQ